MSFVISVRSIQLFPFVDENVGDDLGSISAMMSLVKMNSPVLSPLSYVLNPPQMWFLALKSQKINVGMGCLCISPWWLIWSNISFMSSFGGAQMLIIRKSSFLVDIRISITSQSVFFFFSMCISNVLL